LKLQKIVYTTRQEEIEGLSSNYIANLVDTYENWIGTISLPTLVLNTDDFDFVNNDSHKSIVLDMIKDAILKA